MKELIKKKKLAALPDDVKKRVESDTALLKANKKKILGALSDMDESEKESYFSSILKPKGDVAHQRRHAALAWLKEEDETSLTERKGAKIPVGNPDMRSAYYSVSDGMYGLLDVLGTPPFMHDKKLRSAFKKVQDAMSEFDKRLNDYAWD